MERRGERARLLCEGARRRYQLVGAALLGYALLPLALGFFSLLGWEITSLLGGNTAPGDPSPAWQGAAGLLSALLSGALPFWWLRRKLGLAPIWRRTQMPAGSWRRFGGRCLVLLGLNTLATAAAEALAGLLREWGLAPVSPDFSLTGGVPALFLLLTAVAAAPLVEEYAFRGVLLRALAPCGRRFAIVISALLFALAHGNLLQGLPAFVIGLYLGYLADQTGTPLYTAALHLLNNAVALALPLLEGGWALLYLLVTAGSAAVAAVLYGGRLFCREAALPPNDPAIPREWRWPALLRSPAIWLALGYYLLNFILSTLP